MTTQFKEGMAIKSKDSDLEIGTITQVDMADMSVRATNGWWYMMDEVVPVVPAEPTLQIQTIYMVDSIAFEDLEEAKEHLMKVKLSKILDTGVYRTQEHLLDVLIKNKEQLISILKGT